MHIYFFKKIKIGMGAKMMKIFWLRWKYFLGVCFCFFSLASTQNFSPTALFENVTSSLGLAPEMGTRVTFFDLNNDGYPDLILDATRIYLNQKGQTFIRHPKDSALVPPRGRKADFIQIGDVNNDGLPDLFLGRYTDLSNSSFQNDGLQNEIWLAHPEEGYLLKKDSGLYSSAETSISACFMDFDRDGNLDLFVANAYVAYGKSLEAFPDRLYKGLGTGQFQEVTETSGLLGVPQPGLRESRKPSYGVTHADWNNDGFTDLLVMTYGRQWNRLWKNQGNGTFVDVAEQTYFDGDALREGQYPPQIQRPPEPPFRSNGNTFDAAIADFDNDGDLDCFLTEIAHWWAGDSSDRSMLLINLGAEKQFQWKRELERIPRPLLQEGWNQGDLHGGWLDVDNDGYLDLLIASSDYPDEQILRLYHQKTDHSFEDWTPYLGVHWLNASQISFADFDRDGAIDIVVGRNHMRLTPEQKQNYPLTIGILRNKSAEQFKNHFFNVRLLGSMIGARVFLSTKEHRQMREIQGGLGHSGHRNDFDCHFGVGKAEKIDRLEIHWPDAEQTVQIFENLPLNQFYQLQKNGELEPLSFR